MKDLGNLGGAIGGTGDSPDFEEFSPDASHLAGAGSLASNKDNQRASPVLIFPPFAAGRGEVCSCKMPTNRKVPF